MFTCAKSYISRNNLDKEIFYFYLLINLPMFVQLFVQSLAMLDY